MNEATFQQALLSTARVAMCVSVFSSLGCSGSGENVRRKTNPAIPPATPVSANKAGKQPRKAPIQSQPTECFEHVEEVFSTRPSNPTDKTKECCQEIAQYQDSRSPAPPPWPERNQCCELLHWQGSLACTPWGPPTPPRMPV